VGNGVPTLATPRMATDQTANGEPPAPQSPMALQGVNGVVRTRRHVPARCGTPIDNALVGTYAPKQDPGKETEVRGGFRHGMERLTGGR